MQIPKTGFLTPRHILLLLQRNLTILTQASRYEYVIEFFFYFSNKTYVECTQNNTYLNKTALLKTQKIC